VQGRAFRPVADEAGTVLVPGALPGCRFVVGLHGVKIDQHRLLLMPEQIGRLEVTMADPCRMQLLEWPEQLLRLPALRHPLTLFTQMLQQILTGTVLTDQPGLRAQGAETTRSEEHTSELQSRPHLVCRLLLEKKKT